MVMPYLEESDIAWLASAIDGEGTISIGKSRCIVQIAIYNTNKEYTDRAARLMGCKVYKLDTTKNKIKGLGYCYSAYTNRKMTVLKILKQIEPKLIIKRNKAIEGIRTILDYYDIADVVLRAGLNLP